MAGEDHETTGGPAERGAVADISDEELEILGPLIGALVRLAVRRGVVVEAITEADPRAP